MASLMEQYEQAANSKSPSPGLLAPSSSSSSAGGQQPVGVSGFVKLQAQEEQPLFSKQRIQFKPPDPITHLRVCSNNLVLAMASNLLLRIDLQNKPDQPEEIEITKSVEDAVHNLFLDPSGNHCIISMASTEVFYIAKNSKKPRSLTKLKGHLIDSVGWNMDSFSPNSTGEILLGTSKGGIYETAIESKEDRGIFASGIDYGWDQVFNVCKSNERPVPVCGLHVQKMRRDTSKHEQHYFVLATTPGRLYQFVGIIPSSAERPVFKEHVFKQYETANERFLELPGEFGKSQLVLTGVRSVSKGEKSVFAWMAGPGLFFGDVEIPGTTSPLEAVVGDTKLIPYEASEKVQKPINIVLTEFHILVLYPDRLKAYCRLNEELAYDDPYAESLGRPLGMWRDPMKGLIWCFTSKAVYKYKTIKESRDIWKIYLDSNEFKIAREYCDKSNPADLDVINCKEAEYLFGEKKYIEAAEIYAVTTGKSFEEITLKFIKLNETEALKRFLLKKLSSLKANEKTQMTMLTTWLVEVYLDAIGKLRDRGSFVEGFQAEIQGIREEFHKFLSSSKLRECLDLNKRTIYALISSHGALEDLVFFANLMQDYERVINHYIKAERWSEALTALRKQSNSDLYYKFSPVLMQNAPKETVEIWKAAKNRLDPSRLIPALVRCDRTSGGKPTDQTLEAINYLEFCVHHLQNHDQPIHNYLLSLYCQFQPDVLLSYLDLQGNDASDVCYDLKYALRLCSEHDLKAACVKIYSVMGLFEEAVELALKVDVDLAKRHANHCDVDDEVRKQLWLRIARHVIERDDGVGGVSNMEAAMAVLQEAPGDMLKIEDVLPFFPDFVTIDHFKEPICKSLHQYNDHIESLKKEMEEATASATQIRSDIAMFRSRYAFVQANDKCEICAFPVIIRPFYVFPCGHKFHTDCIIGEILPLATNNKRRQVEDLQRRLEELTMQGSVGNLGSERGSMGSTGSGAPAITMKQQVKQELDELIAAECLFCGEFMIRSVDRPFISKAEYEREMDSWL